jgi:hypothetical protein
MDAENAPIVDKQNMRSRAVTDEEYLKQLDEMPDEQVEWLDKTLAKLKAMSDEHGLSHEEFVDLLTRTWEATESGKSLDEVVAAVMGRQ